MTELVADILASAATFLAEEQPTLSKFTSETNEYEPNLSFHYATILRRFLFWLDCDFDVSKPNLGNRRPDIIFHKRGIHLCAAGLSRPLVLRKRRVSLGLH